MHTQSADRPPVLFEATARVERSLVANGCEIAGHVVRSVLFPGVVVPRGAVVRDSIVMHDTLVGRDAVVDRAIIDKQVRIGAGAMVGHGDSHVPNKACPDHLSSGLTLVGKGAILPAGVCVGRNARIGAFAAETSFTNDVPAGGVIEGPESMH